MDYNDDLLFFLDYARMKPRSSSTSVASSGNSRQCVTLQNVDRLLVIVWKGPGI